MKIASLKERAQFETRAAITPEVTKLLVAQNFTVIVEKDIGIAAGFSNQAYLQAGAKLADYAQEVITDADIILKVQPSPLTNQVNEVELAKSGAIIIGLLNSYGNQEYNNRLEYNKLVGIAMEQMPRITKAQSMDVLSSQSNLAGYRAAIEAIYNFDQAVPMLMTAAGTITPAKALILGAGVAGLQAIATIKRLGAIVAAFDVRKATKEQVESLGAKFIAAQNYDDMENASGYAQELKAPDQQLTRQFLKSVITNYDIIITTALIPGKVAPLLLDAEMVASLKYGSVIVDMAVASGGNVTGSKINEIVIKDGVKIIGWSNLASKVATDSTKLYAKNLYNFLMYAIQDGKFNLADELVKQMLITKTII